MNAGRRPPSGRLTALAGCLIALLYSAQTLAQVAADEFGSAQRCLEQFTANHAWIECRATFETDPQARDAISQLTLGMVRNARCGTDLRVERKGLLGKYLIGGVLQLEPHEVVCSIDTSAARLPDVRITAAPTVTFRTRTVTDVSLGIVSIADLPPLLLAPLSAAAESEPVRRQLAEALNAFLEQTVLVPGAAPAPPQ